MSITQQNQDLANAQYDSPHAGSISILWKLQYLKHHLRSLRAQMKSMPRKFYFNWSDQQQKWQFTPSSPLLLRFKIGGT